MKDVITVQELEQLKQFLNKKKVLEIVVRNKNGRIKIFQKVALADLPQGQAKEMAEKALDILSKNNNLLNKNINAVRQVANMQNIAMVLNGLNLCATCVGFAIMYQKMDEMSTEIMQGFKRLEKQGKRVVDATTSYEINKVLSDHQDMLDCRKKQKPYSEEKMRSLVDQEYNILTLMIDVLQNDLAENKERMIISIFSMLSMFTASLCFFDEQYYFENHDILGNIEPWHSSHGKWMSVYNTITSNSFLELLQDYASFETKLTTLEVDIFCSSLINQAKTLQQEVCDNQTLIEEIGKVDILTSLHKYTTQEVRNELDKAFSAVFENNDDPEIIKVYEEAKKCIALA